MPTEAQYFSVNYVKAVATVVASQAGPVYGKAAEGVAIGATVISAAAGAVVQLVTARRNLNLSSTTQSSSSQTPISAGGNTFAPTSVDRVAGLFMKSSTSGLMSGGGLALSIGNRKQSLDNQGTTTTLQADNQVNLLASQNTSTETSKSSNSAASMGVAAQLGNGGGGMGFTASASAGKGQGSGNGTTYTNTQVAGNTVNITSGGDTTLKGAVITGNTVNTTVGGDLKIQSLQDTSTYKDSSQQVGGSVMVGTGFSGSLSLAQTKINSDYKSVGEQSAIRAGDGGFAVNVQGKTDLVGGQITSTQAAIDNNKNTYTSAGGTTTTDLQNTAAYNANSTSISLGAGSLPGKSASAGMSGVGFGSDSAQANSTTTAGISGVTGNTAARTGDASTAIKPIFDVDKVKKDIEAQVTITQEFNKQAGKAINEFATTQRKTLQDQIKNAATPEEKAQAEINLKDVNMQERALNILVSGLTGMAGAVVTKEALSTAAEKMRDLMIEDSKKFPGVVDSTGKVLSNASGPSDGVRGDVTKVGGTRNDLDLLCGPSNERCKTVTDQNGVKILDLNSKGQVQFDEKAAGMSWEKFLATPEGQKMAGSTGGVQGVAGTLFGFAYEKGSWQDKLIESFAGSHDFIGGKASGLYDEQGNIKRGMSDTERAVYDKGITIGAIPLAAPFAAAEGMSPEMWKAIGILLGAGR